MIGAPAQVITCPVCGLITQQSAALCACGYAYGSRDPTRAIVKLEQDKRDAHKTWSLGLAVAVAMPLPFFLFGGGLFGGALMCVQGVVGVSVAIAGIAMYGDARRKLRAARALRELPEARLLK